ADNKTIFYTVENPAKRQWRLYRHTLGEPASSDTLVYEEKDELYDVYAERSRSNAWIFVTSESKISTEVRAIPANHPTATPRVIVPRRSDLNNYLYNCGYRSYFMTNQ